MGRLPLHSGLPLFELHVKGVSSSSSYPARVHSKVTWEPSAYDVDICVLSDGRPGSLHDGPVIAIAIITISNLYKRW